MRPLLRGRLLSLHHGVKYGLSARWCHALPEQDTRAADATMLLRAMGEEQALAQAVTPLPLSSAAADDMATHGVVRMAGLSERTATSLRAFVIEQLLVYYYNRKSGESDSRILSLRT